MPPTKLEPLDDRVIVRRKESETRKGLIFIPETAQKKMQLGVVISLGESAPAKLKIGDQVLFGQYSGTDVKVEDQELLVVRGEDIIARVIES